MTKENQLADDRIPLIKVICSNCSAEILVPDCIEFDILVCPCCCQATQP